MKSVFRFSVIGVLTLAFAGATFAQDPCADIEAQQATYKEFTDNYASKTIAGREVALRAAKTYVEKYGNCPDAKQQVDYFKPYIPEAEKQIAKLKRDEFINGLYARFDNALKAGNWDEVYASGKEIIAQPEPEAKLKLNITILLGSIGFDESLNNNDKYNADTVRYAQEAIKMIEGGAVSDKYGIANAGKGINYKTKDNALGWLNYTIGYIKYYREKDQSAAIPFLYKATQANAPTKNNGTIYVAIGNWYLNEVQRLDTERTKLLADAKAAEDQANKAGISEEEKTAAINKAKELAEKAKSVYALQKGYADRVTDAFARAYNLFSDPKDKSLRDSVFTNLKEIYKFRNNGKEAGLDAVIAGVKTKPMPNPSTQVTPVVEAAPTEPTTGGTATGTTTTTTAATTKPAATKPVATKPAANTTKPATTPASTATTVKPAAKKPAPKKKGTR